MRNLQHERELAADFVKYANVVEAWTLYDSINICSNYYGNEQNQNGWYTSFAAFGGQETHNYFKSRTESAGLAYCNMQSQDSMDFAFMVHSIGLAFQAPAPNVEGHAYTVGEGAEGALAGNDQFIGHWFASELPNHCAIQLKVQQDIRVELCGLAASPGYGALGNGTAVTGNDDGTTYAQIAYHENAVVQGVPMLHNRFPLPTPIGIPRTGSIEGILHLSEHARNVLQAVKGPENFQFNSDDGVPPFTYFPKRYTIQLSLFGNRLVQQRGQYHAAGAVR